MVGIQLDFMLPSPILLTALSAQILYILVNWYFFCRKEYGFYSIYILCVSFYFINNYLADSKGMVQIGNLEYYKLYPDKILATISYFFYFKFGRHFIDAASRYPGMNRLMKFSESILLLFIIVDIIILYFSRNFSLQNYIFFPINTYVFLVLIYVFREMIRKNVSLDKFILTGSLFYAICALITMLIGQGKSPLDENHIMILQIGAIVEMVFINAGLVYKSRMLQNQTIDSQKQLIEKYLENRDLLLKLGTKREKISRDLHDDVGATLSSIKAYTELLKDNPDNSFIAELIKDNSSKMIERLEVIAWATYPKNDNFRSLKNAMLKFAMPLCHTQNIQCTIENESVNEKMLLPGEIRQNLFLVFKEAINNAIKYANCTICCIRLYIIDCKFVMEISDYERGLNGTIKGSGNGLNNMLKRAEELSGELIINSAQGRGTSIQITLPYPFKIGGSWQVKQPGT